MGVDITLFVDTVPEDCICCICQEVLEDPQETLSCQHAFCNSCITAWLREHNSCPSCRCPLSINELVALHRVWHDKLNRLKVKCQNFRIGCDAIMQLDEAEYHFDMCPYVRVNCPHSPCSEVVVRSHLPRHLEACEYRKVTCPSCHINVPALTLKGHDCISALREDMCRRLEMLKKEWSDSLRVLRREHHKFEEKLHEQASEIEELKSRIVSEPKKSTIPHLPTISVTGNTRRVSVNRTNVAPRRTSRITHHGSSETSNLSLPRLAPLHIHMSLSRNSGNSGDVCARCNSQAIPILNK